MPDFSRGRILAFNGHIRCYEYYLLCAGMRLNWAAYFFVHKNGIFAVSLWIYAYFLDLRRLQKDYFFVLPCLTLRRTTQNIKLYLAFYIL